MKKLLAASAAALAYCGASALAADMPVKMPVKAVPSAPVVNWTGCYVGGNIGGGWSRNQFTDEQGALTGLDEGSHTATGWVGGGQIGCDNQVSNNWVIGVRGMWDWADVTGSNVSAIVPPNTLHSDIRSFASLTGQLGYLLNPTTKLYGMAGIGWADNKWSCPAVAGGTCPPGEVSKGTRSGLDLGVGVAWMIAPHWDLFVEYDHMWLGHKIVTFSNGAFSFPEGIKQDFNKVVVGIDYRFDWGKSPVVAKY